MLGFWSYSQQLKGEGFLAHSNFPLSKRGGPRPSWQFFLTSLLPARVFQKDSHIRPLPCAPPSSARHQEGVARWSPASRRAQARGPQTLARSAELPGYLPEARPSAWKGAARVGTDAAWSARVSVRRPSSSGLQLPLPCSVTCALDGGCGLYRAARRGPHDVRAPGARPRGRMGRAGMRGMRRCLELEEWVVVSLPPAAPHPFPLLRNSGRFGCHVFCFLFFFLVENGS